MKENQMTVMGKQAYKMMKKEVIIETAYGVGFFEGIESQMPSYALIAAIREISGMIRPETSDAELRNMLVTEAIKAMNYQDFKDVAPYLFSYPREQREADRLVRPIEVSREYFEELQSKSEELFQLKKEIQSVSQNLENKIQELETDRQPNGDEVIGVQLERELLLLLRTPETSYIKEWEVMRPGLLTDYRSAEESSYQTLSYLIEQFPQMAAMFKADVINRDKIDEMVQVDKSVITEVSQNTIPDFDTHEQFYHYAKQFESFREEFNSLEDYITKTYDMYYPTDYGLQFYSEAILPRCLEQINQELRHHQKELLVHPIYDEGGNLLAQLSYILESNETREQALYYLEHEVGAYHRNTLAEVAVIPMDSIDVNEGYNGKNETVYHIDTDLFQGQVFSSLEKIQMVYPELADFISLDQIEEVEKGIQTQKQLEKDQEYSL